MNQTKILLDSCSYLRLGKCIHPLLNTVIGNSEHRLFISNDFQREFEKSNRLKNKFEWVDDREFVANRKNVISISKKERDRIENAFEQFLAFADDDLSKIDIKCLAIAYVLGICLITDDEKMSELARELEITVMTTLDLLKLMLVTEHITHGQLLGVIEYWRYTNDLPKNFEKTFHSIFGKLSS